jgi:hypothetical protein
MIETMEQLEEVPVGESITVTDMDNTRKEFTRTDFGWANGDGATIPADLLLGAVTGGRVNRSEPPLRHGTWLRRIAHPAILRVLIERNNDMLWSYLDITPGGVGYNHGATEAGVLRNYEVIPAARVEADGALTTYYRLACQFHATRTAGERLRAENGELVQRITTLNEDLSRTRQQFPENFVRDLHRVADNVSDHRLDNLLVEYEIGREREWQVEVALSGFSDVSPDNDDIERGFDDDFSVDEVSGSVRVDWSRTVTLSLVGVTCVCEDIDNDLLTNYLPGDYESWDWEIEDGCGAPGCDND